MTIKTVREAIEALSKMDPDLEVLELKVSLLSPPQPSIGRPVTVDEAAVSNSSRIS